MREIKFRGKRIDNGEWAYSSLINNLFFKSTNKSPVHYIVDPTQYEEYDSFEDVEHLAIEVDPETVGQYTGLKDKDGKEIYEGDIILLADKLIRFIEYDRGTFVLVRKEDTRSYDLYTRFSPIWEYITDYNFKVIGNIYENPELLEQI